MNVNNRELFRSIARATALKLHHFVPQNLANLAWAFATLVVEDPTVFAAIADEATAKVREFTPHGLANLAWAFATLRLANPPLFYALPLRP